MSRMAAIEYKSRKQLTVHLRANIYPPEYTVLQAYISQIPRLWLGDKVDSGIGLPMVNVLSRLWSGHEVSLYTYSQLRHRIPYTMFFFGFGLDSDPLASIYGTLSGYSWSLLNILTGAISRSLLTLSRPLHHSHGLYCILFLRAFN